MRTLRVRGTKRLGVDSVVAMRAGIKGDCDSD
jgi:hypothetical protein